MVWALEHRDAITLAVCVLLNAATAFAIWSIQRDVRAAWPHIVELWKGRNHDT